MPSPRLRTRSRRQQGWTDRHRAFLASGCDWPFLDGGEGYDLHDQAEPELRDVVADMQLLWDSEREFCTPEACGMNPGPLWFEPYSGPEGNERLVQEVLAYRRHGKLYPHGTACGCPVCQRRAEQCGPFCRSCHPALVEAAHA